MDEALPRGVVFERGELGAIHVHAGIFVNRVRGHIERSHRVIGTSLRHEYLQLQRIRFDGEWSWNIDVRGDLEHDRGASRLQNRSGINDDGA